MTHWNSLAFWETWLNSCRIRQPPVTSRRLPVASRRCQPPRGRRLPPRGRCRPGAGTGERRQQCRGWGMVISMHKIWEHMGKSWKITENHLKLVVKMREMWSPKTDHQTRYHNYMISIYIYQSIFISTSISISRCLCIYISRYIYIYLCIYVSMYLPIYLSIYLSIDLSIYRSIYVSIYLSIYLSI